MEYLNSNFITTLTIYSEFCVLIDLSVKYFLQVEPLPFLEVESLKPKERLLETHPNFDLSHFDKNIIIDKYFRIQDKKL